MSTRLQEVELPEGWALVTRILAFNIGVEIGQLSALLAVVGLGLLALRLRPGLERARAHAGRALIVFATLAALALSFVALRDDASASETSGSGREVVSERGCSEEAHQPVFGGFGGGHLSQSFYPPGQAPPAEDLQHVMGDGYIIVIYRVDIPQAQQVALANWVNRNPTGVVAVPAEVGFPNKVEARTARLKFICPEVDLAALTSFRDRWFAGF